MFWEHLEQSITSNPNPDPNSTQTHGAVTRSAHGSWLASLPAEACWTLGLAPPNPAYTFPCTVTWLALPPTNTKGVVVAAWLLPALVNLQFVTLIELPPVMWIHPL